MSFYILKSKVYRQTTTRYCSVVLRNSFPGEPVHVDSGSSLFFMKRCFASQLNKPRFRKAINYRLKRWTVLTRISTTVLFSSTTTEWKIKSGSGQVVGRTDPRISYVTAHHRSHSTTRALPIKPLGDYDRHLWRRMCHRFRSYISSGLQELFRWIITNPIGCERDFYPLELASVN